VEDDDDGTTVELEIGVLLEVDDDVEEEVVAALTLLPGIRNGDRGGAWNNQLIN